MEVLVCQGAEAKVYLSTYLSKPVIIKERLSKSYRVKELDTKINKQRLLQEARCIVKSRRAGVRTPR
jgi:TP53 regulating kinase-like protein